MATKTKAQLADMVLEHLGVLATGQSATEEDASKVETAIDGAWAILRKPGLVPFATSAIPEWAQFPLRDFVAGLVGKDFGFGDSFKPGQDEGRKELARQVAGRKHPRRVVADFF